MSVKIRLNNKRFLGESLLIGSRLNEEGETIVDASANNASTGNTNASTGNTNNTDNANANANANDVNNQIPPVDQQVNNIIVNAFSQMVQTLNTQFAQIKLPEGVKVNWVQVKQPANKTVQDVLAVTKEYLQNNINAVKQAISQNQGNANNTQTAEQPAQ